MTRRETSITRSSRLLCSHGCGVQSVSIIARDSSQKTIATLECGHVRGELLPKRNGFISLEDIRTKGHTQ